MAERSTAGRLSSGISTGLASVRTLLRAHRSELEFSFRVTVAALLTLVLSQLLNFPLVLWSVLTAILMTQISVGRSVKATVDYLIGTVGGAVYAGVVAALVPGTGEISLLAALAIAIAPVTGLAAVYPRFGVAPFTVVLVILAPTVTHLTPVQSAVFRVLEVALGGIVALVVSFVVLPARADGLMAGAAARVLDLMARALPELPADFTRPADTMAVRRIQDEIGRALASLDLISAEARHERKTLLSAAADAGPLSRTLLRLRHDLVMIGRVAVAPLSDPLRARLEAPLALVAEAATEFLRDSSASLATRHDAPSLDLVDRALRSYSAAVAALLRDGVVHELESDAIEGLFALGFAVEQMHRNFVDLSRSITEFARSEPHPRRAIHEL